MMRPIPAANISAASKSIQTSMRAAPPLLRRDGHATTAAALHGYGSDFGGRHQSCNVGGARFQMQLGSQPGSRSALRTQRHPRPGRQRVPVPAASKASADQHVAAELPGSREQSIQQAAEALTAQLPKEKKGKGAKSGGFKKLAIDVPVADQSASAALQLVRDLLGGLPSGRARGFTLIFGDVAAADAARESLPNTVVAVDSTFRGPLEGQLLIVGATQSQVADVQEMLFGWRGGLAALLNAEWDAEQVGADLAAFVRSFDTVYCFGPLEIQGFFSKKEGCVFKWAKKGSPTATPWHILLREGSQAWQVVGRQQRRPTAGDMEVAFYNAAAATSPITKGVKFVRGLTGGNK